MTPEQEALREKVAREIYDILEGPVADQDFGRQTRQWELSLVLADAAIAVVLKEVEYERLLVVEKALLALLGHLSGAKLKVRQLVAIDAARAALNPSGSPAAS